MGCSASQTNESGPPVDAASVEERAPVPGSRAPWCPEALPEAGAPCSRGPSSPGMAPFTACEYGSDPHCTTIAECGGYEWTILPPATSCSGNPVACPATMDAGSGSTCPLDDNCTYPDGRCSCIPCVATVCGPSCEHKDSGTEWYCKPWDEPPGCPNPRPLLGTACGDAGQYCGGSWDFGQVCSGGYWGVPNGGC